MKTTRPLDSLANRLDRMWLKLSLSNRNNSGGNNNRTKTTTTTTTTKQQQQLAKSSQLRLLNKATNVECIVNNDQYINV